MNCDVNNNENDRAPLVEERDSISYEEFGGDHDYVNCPTCQGKAKNNRAYAVHPICIL